jgi:hypothetical protein
MDRAVAEFAAIMADSSTITVGEGPTARQSPRYSFSERMKAAEFCRDWIMRRRKIKTPDEDQSTALGIDALKDAMRQVTLETLEKERVVRVPGTKKIGRPTREEAAAKRAAAEAAQAPVEPDDEDSAELQKLMKGIS